jgi:hypothetical protein
VIEPVFTLSLAYTGSVTSVVSAAFVVSASSAVSLASTVPTVPASVITYGHQHMRKIQIHIIFKHQLNSYTE